MSNRKLRQMPVWFEPCPSNGINGNNITGRFHVRDKVYVIYASGAFLRLIYVRGWRGRLHPLIEGKTKQAIRQFWWMANHMGECK